MCLSFNAFALNPSLDCTIAFHKIFHNPSATFVNIQRVSLDNTVQLPCQNTKCLRSHLFEVITTHARTL